MIEGLIKKLEKEGKLAAQKVGIVQIEALLKESIIDLEESKKILHIADNTRQARCFPDQSLSKLLMTPLCW